MMNPQFTGKEIPVNRSKLNPNSIQGPPLHTPSFIFEPLLSLFVSLVHHKNLLKPMVYSYAVLEKVGIS